MQGCKGLRGRGRKRRSGMRPGRFGRRVEGGADGELGELILGPADEVEGEPFRGFRSDSREFLQVSDKVE